ncbi:MAG: phosphoglucomutase/phosphomannomutase alpha/beta/alpha domain [Candidatus Aminicenantes bacterium]|nr:phosphoglucomutase/phosphomannomutase alpha/beta/alpha domain [Candidatus Aminicenantes bacterium]
MDINGKIFREYDIRGIVGEDLDDAAVEILGRAMGTFFLARGQGDVAVGRDVRLSSPGFAKALIGGLLSTGCDVADLGVVPTPLLYFSVFNNKMPAGVMITGSHNPPEHNGFKMMSGEETLYGKTIQALYEIVRKGVFPKGEGRARPLDIVPEYTDYVAANVRFARPVKVVLDAGNGTGGAVAVPLFRRLGADVIELFCEPDGRFPNHHPDPTLPEAMEKLVAKVLETGAELGVAYDGDADRIGVVDDSGRVIWGDQLLILFARDILPSRPGAAVISEVKASKVLYDEIARLGGKPIMWRTGHSLIKKKIKEENAPLAGEMSGHIFLNDRWYGFDDAIYASARLVEILARSSVPLSTVMAGLPKTFVTPEIRIYASDEVKFKIVDEVRRELAARYPVIDIDGVRAVFPKGWGLVRASNTQAVIVLRFEADTEADLAAIQKEVRGLLQQVINKLGAS